MAARGKIGVISGGVRVAVAGRVASITLSRPRIDMRAAQDLASAAEEIELDDRVAVVVLQGARGAFCLGVDGPGDWQHRIDWVGAIGALTRPVVAAIGGDAVAEGCELALACDLRIVASRAGFRLPQVVQGTLPRDGGTQRLPRIVGRARAMDILLSGRRVGAREAEAIGLASRVVPAARLASAVRAQAARLAEMGPIALRLAKEAVVRSLDLTLDQGIRLEQDLYVLLQTTADRAEGIGAFRAKRKPRFRGR